MCGIAGLITPPRSSTHTPAVLAERMAHSLIHRGPDDAGTWQDLEVGVALAHRRLSILDLSAAGRQPLLSPNGRYVVTYNGEIYNYHELHPETPSGAFPSDTAALLSGFDRWGVPGTTRRLAGMFAFAVWDRQERVLTLGRDRLGKKPLYYGKAGPSLLFASELKAFRANPEFSTELDPAALNLYLRYSGIPAPLSIYQDARKVPPGTLIVFDEHGKERSREVYWSVESAFQSALADPFGGSPAEAIQEVSRLLTTAVRQRLFSDVPIGALLSGGIDSSLVAALANESSSSPLHTFSIGFADSAFDESDRSCEVAKMLGTVHTELTATPEMALSLIPGLARVYDEPFADSSQIPTLLVSALARRHVTVALTGDGGDEVFGGYNRHIAAAGLLGGVSRWPRALRAASSAIMRIPSAASLDALFRRSGLPQPADKLRKIAEFMDHSDPSAAFEAIRSIWGDPSLVLTSGTTRRPAPEALLGSAAVPLAARMMASDLAGYLPDDILTKVDRASMSVSLEVRSPLLDHRLIEFALRLPVSMKISRGRGKQPLRTLLARRLPAAVFEGPKRGFAIPLAQWLRTDLRDWAESLLSDEAIRRAGILDPESVQEAWLSHLSGRRNNQDRIWNVLMLHQWLNEQAAPR